MFSFRRNLLNHESSGITLLHPRQTYENIRSKKFRRYRNGKMRVKEWRRMMRGIWDLENKWIPSQERNSWQGCKKYFQSSTHTSLTTNATIIYFFNRHISKSRETKNYDEKRNEKKWEGKECVEINKWERNECISRRWSKTCLLHPL